MNGNPSGANEAEQTSPPVLAPDSSPSRQPAGDRLKHRPRRIQDCAGHHPHGDRHPSWDICVNVWNRPAPRNERYSLSPIQIINISLWSCHHFTTIGTDDHGNISIDQNTG